MANLKIERVLALPTPLTVNTIYFVSQSATELKIVAVGSSLDQVRTTVVAGNVETKIAEAIAALTLAQTPLLSAGVDSKIAAAVAGLTIDSSVQLKTDVNTAISTAIGALDLSNSAQLTPTIASRDALTLTKNSFVVVADATGDPTVATGAAMYFFNVGDDSFMKIAEYESMDLTLPNKEILEQFSDVGGQLFYKGAAVGTVQSGNLEW